MGNRLVFAAITLVMLWPRTAGAQRSDDPQVEKGRAVVAQVCTTCHTTLGRMLQVHKQTREQWRELVFFMISRGAQVMPDEIDAVTAFLVATAERDRPAARSPGQPGAK
jgi:mono/diheme cytochrome c family protein